MTVSRADRVALPQPTRTRHRQAGGFPNLTCTCTTLVYRTEDTGVTGHRTQEFLHVGPSLCDCVTEKLRGNQTY